MSEVPSLEISIPNGEQQLELMESTTSEQYNSDSESSSGVLTPKLTRTLSLPRLVKQDENNNIKKTEVINISTSDPSHLFWVPASQHPEISPMEFQKYLETNGVKLRQRSSRKRLSVLSVSYTPPLIDDKEILEDNFVEQQQQEEEEEEEEEENIRKPVLRKSVSLDFHKVNYDEVPDFLVFDRNSSPLDQSQALVPKGDRPLLRRGARTNFKRNSAVAPKQHFLSTRKSESDFTLNDETEEPIINTSDAFKEKELIERDSTPPLLPSLNSNTNNNTHTHNQQHQYHGNNNDNNIHTILEEEPTTSTLDNNRNTRENSTKEKEPIRRASNRKTWSWAFWSDEKSKKNKVDPSSLTTIKPQPSKSIDTALSSSNKRFTFSQFFSKKSKPTPSTLNPNTETNILLPKDFQLNQPQMFMTRLPLHVERAIYKLSHLKLANPRRPLHEQVLISNHMFWYLSIVSTTPLNETNVPKKPHKLVKKSQRPKQTKKKNFSHQDNPNKALMRHSTGFVVPDNYLNPTSTTKRQIDSSSSSSSSSEEEEEPDDLEDVDKDEIPLAMYKSYKS